ncbi:MAG: hypothetical protein E7358_03480 [Clostridiales bacterium]|nr:hypothetical protein [Clostridiales bacterium]
MKSNVCKIEKGTLDLNAILRESEKVAVYNELNSNQTLKLRLICEELDAMLPNVVDEFDGDFWIEFEKGVCKINVLIEFEEFTANKKEALVEIAKNKKNSATKGFFGKIRSVIEDCFLDSERAKLYDMAGLFNFANEYLVRADYSYVCSLKQYKNNVDKEEKKQEWDKLEKSIITSFADDVIVGVKGRQANIVIIKKF